jgi:hypothetical protein
MHRLIRIYALACFGLLAMVCGALPNKACAQAYNLADTLRRKMALYQQMHPSSTLFVHFDKTLYTNNENVWFTAYLLNISKLQLHHTLSASLVNDIDHTVTMQEKFVMDNGISFGNMFLPDTIAPGNYTFMVHTNRMVNNQPEVVFTQPITIKTTAVPDFKALLSLKDTSTEQAGKPRQVMLTANGNDYLPLANAIVNYAVSGKDTSVIYGKGKTDASGQFIINVPTGKNGVKVQVKSKKAGQYVYFPLPQKQGQPMVKFYPEGGNLINNLPGVVGWEVKDTNGNPMRVTGILYNNNSPVDTIKTNNYGLGKFVLTPQAGAGYTVKLIGVPGEQGKVYTLPSALHTGVALQINRSIADDTLKVQIRSTYTGRVYLHIHNYENHFISLPLQVKANTLGRVSAAINDLPKGLMELTLTDSMGKPYAGRIFFAHYNRRDQLSIKTDKSTYITRGKVYLKLQLNSMDSIVLQGAVSVACVQDNRIELKKFSDIESYTYLKSVLADVPLKENYLGAGKGDKEYLEDLLLIKGWRKYLWPQLFQSNAVDTSRYLTSAMFTGKVTVGDKPLKKPAVFVLLRDSSSSILNTDAAGNFLINENQLLTAQDRPVRFLMDASKGYKLQVKDPYVNLAGAMSKQFNAPAFENIALVKSTEDFVIKGLEKAIQLRAVTVSAVKGNTLYGGRGITNSCGDYVCVYNILNCSNHVFDTHTIPVIGQRYISNGLTTVYSGCQESKGAIKSMHGIYASKEFYGSDYSVVNPPEPEYASTIYWKHLVNINSKKPTELSFYTSDITGKYRIVVQGLTSNGVTFSESFISVKKP